MDRLNLIEAYFAFPWTGPLELARLTGMTFSEVVEQLDRRGFPRTPVFDRQIRQVREGKGGRPPTSPSVVEQSYSDRKRLHSERCRQAAIRRWQKVREGKGQ